MQKGPVLQFPSTQQHHPHLASPTVPRPALFVSCMHTGSWVSTKGTGMEKDAAMRGSFMKLFDYISGANSAKAKIPMTAPVLTKIEPGQGPNCESTFTMSFYNPYNYQVWCSFMKLCGLGWGPCFEGTASSSGYYGRGALPVPA